MKVRGTGRIAKALGASLALGLGMSACSRDYTLGYLYVASATSTTNGVINAYAIDFQSGALLQLADSPIPSDGNNPVGLVLSPNGKQLYVINQISSTVTVFDTGTDGKIYEKGKGVAVVSGNGLVGTTPTALAIDSQGKFLYVTFQYQNGFTPLKPGPGGIAIFPIAADGTLGSPVTNTTVGTTAANPLPYVPVGNNPVGIVTSPKGGYVYVVDQENRNTPTAFGVLLAFSENASTGALTQITGTVSGGFAAGTAPGGIAEDPSNNFLYVSDSVTNNVYAYGVGTAGGRPIVNLSGPFAAGLYPRGITVDPRGKYVYVANFGSSTVTGYSINQATGALSSSAGSAGQQVNTGPTCVTIEPALGIYMYTSNNTDNTVSGLQLSPNTGGLTIVRGSAFSAQALPTCAVAVANGAHATQLVN